MRTATVFYGSVINPQDLQSFKALNRCLLAVDAAGNIDWLVDDVEESLVQETMSQKGYIDVDVIPLKDSQFIIPGFIDTHTVCVPASSGDPVHRLICHDSMHRSFQTSAGIAQCFFSRRKLANEF